MAFTGQLSSWLPAWNLLDSCTFTRIGPSMGRRCQRARTTWWIPSRQRSSTPWRACDTSFCGRAWPTAMAVSESKPRNPFDVCGLFTLRLQCHHGHHANRKGRRLWGNWGIVGRNALPAVIQIVFPSNYQPKLLRLP